MGEEGRTHLLKYSLFNSCSCCFPSPWQALLPQLYTFTHALSSDLKAGSHQWTLKKARVKTKKSKSQAKCLHFLPALTLPCIITHPTKCHLPVTTGNVYKYCPCLFPYSSPPNVCFGSRFVPSPGSISRILCY